MYRICFFLNYLVGKLYLASLLCKFLVGAFPSTKNFAIADNFSTFYCADKNFVLDAIRNADC